VIQRLDNFQTPDVGNQNVQRTLAALNNAQASFDQNCHNYGEKGHYANQCPKPHLHPNQTPAANLVPTHCANFVPVAAKQNYARGRVNHVVVEEAQEASDVVLGMFLINTTTTVVVFDSRASHSFISTVYVNKHSLPISLLKCQIIVSSLGGDMRT
jgi:hypothetical protein